MPFVWWNASDITVKNFYVVDPPLWAINLMNVTNAWFDNIYVNATSPQQPAGKNWVVNTDGFGMSFHCSICMRSTNRGSCQTL